LKSPYIIINVWFYTFWLWYGLLWNFKIISGIYNIVTLWRSIEDDARMARELQRDELISGKKERIRREANDMVDNRVHCTDCGVRGGDFVKST